MGGQEDIKVSQQCLTKSAAFYFSTPGGGLPYEKDGDARRLA